MTKESGAIAIVVLFVLFYLLLVAVGYNGVMDDPTVKKSACSGFGCSIEFIGSIITFQYEGLGLLSVIIDMITILFIIIVASYIKLG